jgi:hypothetical protein
MPYTTFPGARDWRSRSQRSRAAAIALVACGLVLGPRDAPALKFVSVDVGRGGGADVPPAGDSVGDIHSFKSVARAPATGKRVGLTESWCAMFDIAKTGYAEGPTAPL